jgi:hypothetical protein
MAHQPRVHRLSVHTWVLVMTMAIFWVALGAIFVPRALTYDFLDYYSGGRLLLEGAGDRLYDPAAQLDAQRSLFPQLPVLVPFVRPPFYAAFLALFALLPLTKSFVVWLLLQVVVYAVCINWGRRKWGSAAVVFAAIFLPTPLGIASGQDCAFFLAIIIGVLILESQGRDLAAGAILGLGLVKFNLFVLWPVALLLQKRWRLVAGAAAVVAVEIILSLALVGRSGMFDYVRLLRTGDINPSQHLMVNVYSLALNFGLHSAAAVVLLTVVVLSLASILAWNSSFSSCVAAACLGSLLISPHALGYDATLLLPVLWSVLFESKSAPAKILAVFLCSPVPYLLNLADSPWSSTTPVALLALLSVLAWQNWKSASKLGPAAPPALEVLR